MGKSNIFPVFGLIGLIHASRNVVIAMHDPLNQTRIQTLACAALASILGRVNEQAMRFALPAGAPESHKVGCALLRVSFDHAASVSSILAHHGRTLSGSAFALLRPMTEAIKRGSWIGLCATEEQAAQFLDKGALPKPMKLAADLEGCLPFNINSYFSDNFKSAGDLLHDFIHGGGNIARCYLAGDGIGAAFSDKDIEKVLLNAENTAMAGVQVMAQIAACHDQYTSGDVISEIGCMQSPWYDGVLA